MPLGELEEIVDAHDILNGFLEESIEDEYIPEAR